MYVLDMNSTITTGVLHNTLEYFDDPEYTYEVVSRVEMLQYYLLIAESYVEKYGMDK